MKDVNYPIRKAYNTALAGVSYNSVAVETFYQFLPDGIHPDLYIVIDSISNNNAGTINSQETRTSVTVTVHSFGEKYSNGQAVDDVAGQVLAAINPSPSGVLDLSDDDLQMAGTTLQADNTQTFSSQGNRIYIDRVLIFEHHIYQK
jgi:hypothetical protein